MTYHKNLKKKAVSYVNYNTNFTAGIPQHLQRIFIYKEYEKKFNIEYDYLEYLNMSHLPVLNDILDNKKIKNIILFSIYSLTNDKRIQKKIILNFKKKNIIFANEFISTKLKKDRILIKQILKKI